MARPLLETIDDLLRDIDEKTAADGVADPGGYMGGTSHPSKNVDDYVQKATTGARAAENEKDNKENHPGAGVDSVSPGSGGSQTEKMPNIGVHQSETGGEPSVEDNYKKKKEDPTSAHPSHTAEDQGEKYSSMHFDDLCKSASDLANEILADFANGFGFNNKQSNQQVRYSNQPTQKTAQVQASTKKSDQEMASSAGYDLAAVLGDTKRAADEKMASEVIESVLKDADFDADLVGNYYRGYISEKQALLKAADAGQIPPELLAAAGGAGGAPPGGGMPPPPPGGDAPPMDPSQGGAMPPMPPGGGDGGGPPMTGDDGGVDPSGGDISKDMSSDAGSDNDADGQGGGDAGGHGKVTEEQALQALLAAMRDMGVGEGELAGKGDEGAKVAAAAKNYARSGRFEYREAKTAQERALRSDMRSYLRELINS